MPVQNTLSLPSARRSVSAPELQTVSTYLSLSASLFKSENNGIEFLNSFILSSRIWQMGNALISRGSFRSCLINPSIPSESKVTSRFAQRVFAHSSLAA